MAGARPSGAATRHAPDPLAIAGLRAAQCTLMPSTAALSFCSPSGGMLGMVHATLGLRPQPAPAGGRIPTLAGGLTGSMAPKSEQRVTLDLVANGSGFLGRGAPRPHRGADLQQREAS
jgi:hypothetical protein